MDEKLRVRVTDNALSRDLFPTDYYCLGDNENRPIKWLAIESLLHKQFTGASDVVSITRRGGKAPCTFNIKIYQPKSLVSVPPQKNMKLEIRNCINAMGEITVSSWSGQSFQCICSYKYSCSLQRCSDVFRKNILPESNQFTPTSLLDKI